MDNNLIRNTARSISTFAALSNAPACVTGGWATGKTRLTVEIATQYARLVTGEIWLVGETTESTRNLEIQLRQTNHDPRRFVVLSIEDYDERLRHDAAYPSLVIYDDADRYNHHPVSSANTIRLANGPLNVIASARYELQRSRSRDRTIDALNSAGLPGTAPTGTSTQRFLRQSIRPRTQQLVRAINGKGLACIAHPARQDARRTVMYSTNEVVRTLNHTYLDDLVAPTLRKDQPTRVAVSISDQRSGHPGVISPDESALPMTPSLLEDLAAFVPEVAVIASLDDDLEHLARLASTASFGTVVVTTWGSPTHRVLDDFTIPSW